MPPTTLPPTTVLPTSAPPTTPAPISAIVIDLFEKVTGLVLTADSDFTEYISGGVSTFRTIHGPEVTDVVITDLWTSAVMTPIEVSDDGDVMFAFILGAGTNRYRVEYTCGFSSYPDAITYLLEKMDEAAKKMTLGFKSETNNGYSYTLADASNELSGIFGTELNMWVRY